LRPIASNGAEAAEGRVICLGMRSYQQVRHTLSKATQEVTVFGHFAGLTASLRMKQIHLMTGGSQPS
jgi:hypothetical protein